MRYPVQRIIGGYALIYYKRPVTPVFISRSHARSECHVQRFLCVPPFWSPITFPPFPLLIIVSVQFFYARTEEYIIVGCM
jgi:hypothetical protein